MNFFRFYLSFGPKIAHLQSDNHSFLSTIVGKLLRFYILFCCCSLLILCSLPTAVKYWCTWVRKMAVMCVLLPWHQNVNTIDSKHTHTHFSLSSKAHVFVADLSISLCLFFGVLTKNKTTSKNKGVVQEMRRWHRNQLIVSTHGIERFFFSLMCSTRRVVAK